MVSFSFAIAAISPTLAVLMGVCFLPSIDNNWPNLSLTFFVELKMVDSESIFPDMTLRRLSFPANGSAKVLNIKAENGASSTASNSTFSTPSTLWPFTFPLSVGKGND